MAINPYDPRMQACFIASTVTAVAGITALAVRYLFPKEQLSPSPMAQRNVEDTFLKTQLPETISSSSVSTQERPKEDSVIKAVDNHDLEALKLPETISSSSDSFQESSKEGSLLKAVGNNDLEALKKLIPWYQSHRNQENVETEIKSAFVRAFEELRHYPYTDTLPLFKLLDNTLVTSKIRHQTQKDFQNYRPFPQCSIPIIKEYPEFYDKLSEES